MDLISHGLWSALVFNRKKGFGLAVVFGVLPDIIAFTPFHIQKIITQGLGSIFAMPQQYPQWVITLYNSTHSLLIAGVIFCLLLWYRRDLAILFLAWPLHILFDIPTHSAGHFATKFLYPLSTLHFDGIHWRTWYVFVSNWIAVLIAYFIFLRLRKRTARNGIQASIANRNRADG